MATKALIEVPAVFGFLNVRFQAAANSLQTVTTGAKLPIGQDSQLMFADSRR